jgi:hypothetical protein
MPTLFDRLDTALEGNELSTRLPETVGRLTAVSETVVGLIQDPPDSLGDLGQALNELPLPELLGGDFASSLGAVQGAVPAELSSVVVGLSDGLAGLQDTVGRELAGVLDGVLEAIRAIDRLAKIDLTCLSAPEPVPSGASGGPGGGSPGHASLPGGVGNDRAPSSSTGPGSIAEAANQIQAINDALDVLPSPLNVENLLGWLSSTVGMGYKRDFLPATLPIIDEIIDPLNTLTAWNAFTSDQIRDHLAQSVQDLAAFIHGTAPGVVSALASDLAATAGQLETTALAQVADGLTARLGELAAAVNGADLSGTAAAVAEINARLDSYADLRSTMHSGLLSVLPSLNARLGALADDVTGEMGHLVSVLRPNPSIGALVDVLPEAGGDLGDAGAIGEQLQPLSDWIEALADLLDVQAIQEPLSSAAETMRTAVSGLEQDLVQVTVQVRAMFAEVESLLDEIDTEALVDQVRDALDSFEATLSEQIRSLFEPARDAIAQVISSIDGQIDAFSPDDVIDALRQVMASVTSVFEDPAVVSAIGDVRDTLEQAQQQLEQLSFAPLTDQVIAGMEEISAALSSIDASDLDAMLQAALQAALAILPDDVRPLTDPLIDEFGGLIESGPVPLLQQVQAQPEKLLDAVRAFEPAALIGDALSKPYEDLLSQMQAFKPSRLLDPVNDELEKLKQRLASEASPGELLAALEPPFNELLSHFDQFKPGDVVQPLNDAISHTIDGILDVLPVDEILGQVDAVLGSVQEVVDFGENLASMFAKIEQILAGLADSENQLTNWMDAILDKVEAIGDLSPVETAFAALAAALDETRAAALAALFDGAAAPLSSALETLDPGTRHTGLIQAYSRFPRSALESLPDSAEKTAIIAALDRFNPLDPDFGRPYQALLGYGTALSQAGTDLQAVLVDWDGRYHAGDGTLAGFRVTGVTAAQIRTWLQEEMSASFLEPLKSALARLELSTPLLDAVFTQITNLVTTLQGKISALLLGPGSLGDIRGAFDDLVQDLRDFNLDFLTESLEGIFDQVRAKVDAINPANLKGAIDDLFEGMLGQISLDLIIPAGDLETLDSSFDALIGKLEALDPEKLVVEVVQPEYEETIVPLIDTFDLTGLLETIIERLRSLDEELKEEMERVNEAFRAMKGSVPAMSAAAAISL